MRKISHIVVHHSASPLSTTVKSVDNFHKTKNWGTSTNPSFAKKSKTGWYVTYHKFIEADGTITTTHEDDEIGWHASEYNPFSLGVCLAGFFDKGKDTPTKAQIDSLTKVLKEWANLYGILPENIIPHRKVPRTHKTCFGDALHDDFARNLVFPMKQDAEVIKVGSKIYYLEKEGVDKGLYVDYGDGAIMKSLYGGYRNDEVKVLPTLPPNMSKKKLSFVNI